MLKNWAESVKKPDNNVNGEDAFSDIYFAGLKKAQEMLAENDGLYSSTEKQPEAKDREQELLRPIRYEDETYMLDGMSLLQKLAFNIMINNLAPSPANEENINNLRESIRETLSQHSSIFASEDTSVRVHDASQVADSIVKSMQENVPATYKTANKTAMDGV